MSESLGINFLSCTEIIVLFSYTLQVCFSRRARQPSTGGTRRGSEAAAPEAGGPCGWVAGTLEPKIHLAYCITSQNTLAYSLSQGRPLQVGQESAPTARGAGKIKT